MNIEFVGIVISLVAAFVFMVKMTDKKHSDLKTVIQYATLSIYFLLSAVILKM